MQQAPGSSSNSANIYVKSIELSGRDDVEVMCFDGGSVQATRQAQDAVDSFFRNELQVAFVYALDNGYLKEYDPNTLELGDVLDAIVAEISGFNIDDHQIEIYKNEYVVISHEKRNGYDGVLRLKNTAAETTDVSANIAKVNTFFEDLLSDLGKSEFGLNTITVSSLTGAERILDAAQDAFGFLGKTRYDDFRTIMMTQGWHVEPKGKQMIFSPIAPQPLSNPSNPMLSQIVGGITAPLVTRDMAYELASNAVENFAQELVDKLILSMTMQDEAAYKQQYSFGPTKIMYKIDALPSFLNGYTNEQLLRAAELLKEKGLDVQATEGSVRDSDKGLYFTIHFDAKTGQTDAPRFLQEILSNAMQAQLVDRAVARLNLKVLNLDSGKSFAISTHDKSQIDTLGGENNFFWALIKGMLQKKYSVTCLSQYAISLVPYEGT